MIEKFLVIKKTRKPKSCEFEDEYDLYRDSIIKRYEFCYILTWKFLKLYLQKNYGIEVASPKKVFQECVKQNLVPINNTTLLFETIKAYNNCSHLNNEKVIHAIAQKIPEYYNLFMEVIKKLPM